jgi:ABC-type iron transport system FetAB ATPase subunit
MFDKFDFMCEESHLFYLKTHQVDGTAIDPVAFRRNVAYVMQDDALVPTATPREALAFSAALRLTVSPEEQVRSLFLCLFKDALVNMSTFFFRLNLSLKCLTI